MPDHPPRMAEPPIPPALSPRHSVERRLRELLAAWTGDRPAKIVMPPAMHRELWLECSADDAEPHPYAVLQIAGIPILPDAHCPPDTIYALPRNSRPPTADDGTTP